MQIHILGKKDDLKKMQSAADLIKKTCQEISWNCEIILTHNFSEIAGQSFNASQTPIIFFDKQVEFSGVPEPKLLKAKLMSVRNTGTGF